MNRTIFDQVFINKIFDYIILLKPGVMVLVVFTAIVGQFICLGEKNIYLGCIAILCIAIASGASAAINMWYDKDIDKHMERTKKRPIPTGRIAPYKALLLGSLLAFFAVFIIAIFINYISTILLIISIIFYVLIYTIWLKRRTPHNIVIGGAAGAFPPIIGWTSITGTIDINALTLFMIIFMWTPPHFWSLALFRSDDYAKVYIPMLPVVSGKTTTRKMIFIYTIILLIMTIIPIITKFFGTIYIIITCILNSIFLYYTFFVIYEYNCKPFASQNMFRYSILYLFLLFSSMIFDSFIKGIFL